jgi:hypothetical protein
MVIQPPKVKSTFSAADASAARIDREQAGGSAAAASRRKMIERTIASSKPRTP